MSKLLACAAFLAAASCVCADDDVDYRLPQAIQPVSQSIELRIDPEQAEFSGRVEIRLRIDTDVDRIGVNQVGLELTSIELSAEGEARALEAVAGDYEINWLADGGTIAAGEYVLSIDFNGRHSTDSLGMHRVTFEGNGYVYTQMEAMYARRSMPIFDEPGFKIPYDMTIFAPEENTVLFNTPVAKRSVDDGWQRVEFMRSKPLPSYLLAWAVGPMDRAPLDGMSIPGFVYVPKGHADTVGFVQRETPKILKTLEDYFGLDYPYRKLDFVAVPEFAFGAMENPGLITYRTDMLMIGDTAEGQTAVRTLGVIAHEIGHIWFGDLVTLTWWNDLWLNESFASWITYKTLETVYPQYEANLYLPQIGALAVDQKTTTRPIRRAVKTQTDALGDIGLNYSKGSVLLRVLENYVGFDTWQRGMQAYISRYAWGNTTAANFWDTMSEVSGLDVGSIAWGYLNQPGYAILEFDTDGNVTQQRFLPLGRQAEDLEWQVPLNIKYKADNEIRETFYLLDEKTGRIDVPQDADWIFPDAGGNGYFRWQLDPEQYQALVYDMPALANREKMALLDNVEALLDTRRVSLADYLFVIGEQLADQHPSVCLTALEKLIEIGKDFISSENADPFGNFVDATLAARFAEIGSEARPGDSEAMLRMRPRLLRALGQYGSDPPARIIAADLADRYLEDARSVNSDIGLEALRVTALADNGDKYDQYIKAYLRTSSEKQKTNILKSIYFRNPDVLRRHLDFSISAAVPAGDAMSGVYYYADILDDHSDIYAWLHQNLDTFEAKLPAIRRTFIPEILVGQCNERNLELMQTFFSGRDEKYSGSLARAVENIENCIARKQRESGALMDYLARYAG